MLYIYEASDEDGAISKGEIESSSTDAVVEFLVSRSLVPVSVRVKGEKLKRSRLKLALFETVTPLDRIFLVRNLNTTLKAGLSITEAIDILIRDTEKDIIRDILMVAKSNLQNGQPLSETFAGYKQHFPIFFVGMLRAGEISGKLVETLNEMNIYLTREFELTKKVKSALSYPAVLMVGSFGVLSLLLGFVVPRLARVFSQSGVKLPLVTRIMLALSNIVTYSIVLDIIFILFLFWFVVWFRKTDAGKKFIAKLSFKLPLVNIMVKKVALVRYARTLGSLLASGSSILDAVRLAGEATGNEYYKESSAQVMDEISKGIPLSKALEKYTNLYPHFLVSLVTVGERTGSLEHVLKTFAEYTDEELDYTLKNLTTILEPILLLVMGVIIGSIALSVLLPIYQYIERSAL